MTSQQRIKEIFEAALDSPPNQRERLLVELCANDDFVQAEVQALLKAHAESDGFLAGSPLGNLTFDRMLAIDLAGRRIGVYELQREIGQGGMATVYLAERIDGEFRQQVALKIVWPGANAAEITRRFKQERQILASLDHPNIARLLDGGTTEEGLPYLVMEYIAGQPITNYCQANNLLQTERLRLFQTVCAAVAYAHRNLVIHRDIKPGNILVTEDGAARLPKLLDFGIAKVLAPDSADEAQHTITGLRPMTPEYASPEQLREETITTATDVYSLGVLLYELLTGSHPFELKNLRLHELTRVVCDEDPLPPSARVKELRGELRGDLDNIVLMALRKDARLRYQTVEQFSEDISRYLVGNTVIARPATLFYRTRKFTSRNKTIVTVTATVILLLLVGLFFTLRQNRQQRYELYAADMRQAGADWGEGNLVQMDALLERHRPGTASDEWRGFEWFALSKLLRTEKFTLPHQAWVPTVLYTPDGKMLLTGSDDGRIEMWDAASGQSLGLFAMYPEGVYRLVISADGTKLAATGGRGLVRIWDFASRRVIAERPSTIAYQSYLTFSPDGQRLAIKINSQKLEAWDTTKGRLVEAYELPTIPKAVEDGPAIYSPDGRLLCLAQTQGRWHLWDVAKRRTIVRLDPQSSESNALITYYPTGHIFSHDGQRFYLPTQDFLIRAWDINSGKLLHVFRGHQDNVETPALSHDDKLLASGSDDKTLRLWDTQTGKLLATIKNESQTFSPVFSPDDKYLAAVCMRALRVKVWEAPKLLSESNTFDGVRMEALAPDGKTMLTSALEKKGPALRDAQTGQPLIFYQDLTLDAFPNNYGVQFSPDGRLFTTRRAPTPKPIVEIRETASGKLIASLTGHAGYIIATAFAPNGKTLATVAEDGFIKFWETATWWEVASIRRQPNIIFSIEFSPDSSKLLVCGRDHIVQVWDVASRKHLLDLRGHRGWVIQAKYSPDGKLIASPSWDYTIKLWDAATGRELRTLKGHANSVYCVAFSPDGKRLASGGDDTTVRLWDVQTGKELTSLRGHTGKVWRVAFTPDGKTLVSSGEDGTRIWRTATEEKDRRSGTQW